MSDKKGLLKSLEELCGTLNIKLRFEKTMAKGGLCKVNGIFFIIIDKKADEDYKCKIIAKELRNFDLSSVPIKPKVREFIEES